MPGGVRLFSPHQGCNLPKPPKEGYPDVGEMFMFGFLDLFRWGGRKRAERQHSTTGCSDGGDAGRVETREGETCFFRSRRLQAWCNCSDHGYGKMDNSLYLRVFLYSTCWRRMRAGTHSKSSVRVCVCVRVCTNICAEKESLGVELIW